MVSDNDGSAFITKAEFDSLKNNFQSQIDQYNTSIDSKIDGAIASYLAGIRTSKETSLNNLVENYKELYWLHDFSLVAKTQNFTNRTTRTYTDTNDAVQPNYNNLLGFIHWFKNRGIPANWLWGSNLAGTNINFNLYFASDTNTSQASRTGTDSYTTSRYNPALLCITADTNGIIKDPVLVQFYDVLYNVFAKQQCYQSETIYNFYLDANNTFDTPSTSTRVLFQPLTIISGDYWDIKASRINKSSGVTMNFDTFRWTDKNFDLFPLQWEVYDSRTPYNRADGTSLECTLYSYPMYNYYAPSDTQATNDIIKVKNMMIGGNSSYQIPMMFGFGKGGESGWQGRTPYSSDWDANYTAYWCDWSKWNKKNQNVELHVPTRIFVYGHNVGGTSTRYGYFDSSVLNPNFTIQLPVHTQFKLDNLKSPTAIYNNEHLNICGGMPIANEIQNEGKLKVQIKCTKHSDNATKASPTDVNAKIRFKTSDYLNTNNDYITGTKDTQDGSTILFDGSQTIDVADTVFYLDVKKDSNVWMNIDPITLGQHIKISDLKVSLLVE